jgi:hypothetical protein
VFPFHICRALDSQTSRFSSRLWLSLSARPLLRCGVSPRGTTAPCVRLNNGFAKSNDYPPVSVRMEQLGFHWTEFYEFICRENSTFIKIRQE